MVPFLKPVPARTKEEDDRDPAKQVIISHF